MMTRLLCVCVWLCGTMTIDDDDDEYRSTM